MIQLLQKDFAISRNTILFGFVLTLAPFLCYACFLWGELPQTRADLFNHLGRGATYCSIYGAMLNCFCICLVAASIVAMERQSRSAEFLAYLPPTKFRILMSKLVVCLAYYLATCCFLATVFFLLAPRLTTTEIEQLSPLFLSYLSLSFAIFGCAWLGSCLFQMAQHAALFGLSVPITLNFLIYHMMKKFLPSFAYEMSSANSLAVSLAIGGAGLLLGFVVYTRRVNP